MGCTAEELFQEIRETGDGRLDIRARYAKLLQLLERVCWDFSADSAVSYSRLFSRLYAVCRSRKVSCAPADRFRRNARIAVSGRRKDLTETDFLADRACLLSFLSDLYCCPLPDDLLSAPGRLPERGEATPPSGQRFVKKIRAVVTAVDAASGTFRCVAEETSAPEEWHVQGDACRDAVDLIEEGTQLNLLNVEISGDACRPSLIIVEPDFLVDVSALTACCKAYGSHPLNYFLSSLSPRPNTRAILLGNAANQFMDDCVNEESPDFEISVKRHFRNALLDYTCCRDSIGREFFDDAGKHFRNIRAAVDGAFSASLGMSRERIQLEPSFICEALGLRARLDVMTDDRRCVVELKSGRADDFGHAPRPRKEHVLQMALYKEILHYNFSIPREEIRSFLFYSAYPLLFEERASSEAVREVLSLRNRIVRMEILLGRGHFETFRRQLTVASLNEGQLSGRFFESYLKPQLQELLAPLHAMGDLEKAYFNSFLAFIEREKLLSKVGDGRPGSGRGFSSAWTLDATSKAVAGDLLADLRICGMEDGKTLTRIAFRLPEGGETGTPNFNVGEMVQLYERNDERADVTNRQIVRAYVESLAGGTLVLRLAYPQRYNKNVFSYSNKYAVEHDASDVVFAQELRGLYALLGAPQERKALVFGQRPPRFDRSRVLLGSYGKDLDGIVLAAKQAEDYFLLMGPPGTGKTNVVLRAMVHEFLLGRRATGKASHLLLTAYTNRAVDEICGMLAGMKGPDGLPCDFLRIGKEQTCDARFHSCLLDAKAAACRNRKMVAELLRRTPVFVGTVTAMTLHSELYDFLEFEAAVVDEASQLVEPQLLGLLSARHEGRCAIRKFVMIGDHKQLPAVVLLPRRHTAVTEPLLADIGISNLGNSLFERLWHLQRRAGGCLEATAMLREQGRMHRDICSFVSDCFYGRELRALPTDRLHAPLPFDVSKEETPVGRFVASFRMAAVDVRKKLLWDNDKVNLEEAGVVAALAASIADAYRKNGLSLELSRQLGIIVPFRNQIGAVRRALERVLPEVEGITIDTVECYQGSQRDIIIYSTTVSRRYQMEFLSAVADVDGVPTDRKLNVALTRAREQVFVVGDVSVLSESPVYRKLFGCWKVAEAGTLLAGT